MPDATVYTLGDNAYESGTLSEFQAYYDPTWGTFKARTHPSVGNHEYNTAGASGYFDYFGAAAGNRGEGWYSYDVGKWHLIALNANCSIVNCAPTSTQTTWLKNDLASHTNSCTLAYWHQPLFSSGQHGNDSSVKPFWDQLYASGADVVLNGHDHMYERFAPQNPSGSADSANGIREFVVGTGGRDLYQWGTIKPNSQFRDNQHHGVLKLVLHDGSYDWQFIDTSSATGGVLDSGTGQCHAAPPPPPPSGGRVWL
jgi:acid phosphatase type 7